MDLFTCFKCGCEIVIPKIEDHEKYKIIDLLHQNLGLGLMGYIHKTTGLNLKDSKALYFHINKTTGHCHRCNNDTLVGEKVICPKCKSFNTNWIYK